MLIKPLNIILIVVIVLGSIAAQQWEFAGLQTEDVNTIVIDTSDENVIYAGTRSDYSDGTWGKIVKSIDGGITWDTLLYGIDVAQIVIHPGDSDVLYATLASANASPPGIVKTIDGGEHWFQADSGIYVDWETSVVPIAIDPMHPDTLYAGTGGFFGGSLYKSFDGGVSWHDIGGEISDDNISAIAIDPNNTHRVYVGTIGINKVFRTTNGGGNWVEMGQWQESGGIYTLTIDYHFSDTIYAGIYQLALLKSTDAGSTWVDIVNGLTENRISSMVLNPTNSAEMYVGTYEGGVFRSVSGGSLWVEMNEGLSNKWVNSLVISPSESEIYCGTHDGVYKASITVSIRESKDHSPQHYKLNQNYPNPFNQTTTIQYQLAKETPVVLEVVDIKGRTIKTLVNGSHQIPGVYTILCNERNGFGVTMPTGIYFYRLRTNSFVETKKLLLLK